MGPSPDKINQTLYIISGDTNAIKPKQRTLIPKSMEWTYKLRFLQDAKNVDLSDKCLPLAPLMETSTSYLFAQSNG